MYYSNSHFEYFYVVRPAHALDRASLGNDEESFVNNVATKISPPAATGPSIIRTISDIVEYLDRLPSYEYGPQAVARMQQLNELFGNVMHAISTILVGGSTGKSLAIHFAVRLFNEEQIATAAIFSSHFLNYNERILLSGEVVAPKIFADTLIEVIEKVEGAGIAATAHELMLIAGFLQAVHQKVDLVLVEVAVGGQHDVAAICRPLITAVTRIADDATGLVGAAPDAVLEELTSLARPGSFFVSSEQSKIVLQQMKKLVESRGGTWTMPIRKLAPLPYVWEQLYGRTASLGERLVQLYVEDILKRFSPLLRGNILATQQGQRGRPTREAKRNAEINPIKTLKNFWRGQSSFMRGHFEVLEKEKPLVVLDNASNVDGLMNVFLGVRLLHYQKPLKGFVLIVGVASTLDQAALFDGLRYLFKKVPGEVIFIPVPGVLSCLPQALVAVAREQHIRARACSSFEEAFLIAKEHVDARDGLIAVAGSPRLVTAYWRIREVKRF